MTKFDKSIQRLKNCPQDYTFDEAKALLIHFGFTLSNKGEDFWGKGDFLP